MSESTPRDVLAVNLITGCIKPLTLYGGEQAMEVADAILDALDQAGFQVTPKPVIFNAADFTVNGYTPRTNEDGTMKVWFTSG
jgi:hypothetical protein